MSHTRHFLTLNDLNRDELLALLQRASELKKLQRSGVAHDSLKGKVMAMIFAKSSTRTRVSFEAGMTQLGGSAMFLSSADTQMGRGEPMPSAPTLSANLAHTSVLITAHSCT